MDSLTQAALGAALGEAILAEKDGKIGNPTQYLFFVVEYANRVTQYYAILKFKKMKYLSTLALLLWFVLPTYAQTERSIEGNVDNLPVKEYELSSTLAI